MYAASLQWVYNVLKSMEKRSGLTDGSVLLWVSAVDGCLFKLGSTVCLHVMRFVLVST